MPPDPPSLTYIRMSDIALRWWKCLQLDTVAIPPVLHHYYQTIICTMALTLIIMITIDECTLLGRAWGSIAQMCVYPTTVLCASGHKSYTVNFNGIQFACIPFNCKCNRVSIFWTKNGVQYLWIWRDVVTNFLYDGQCRAWRSHFFFNSVRCCNFSRRKVVKCVQFTAQQAIS